MELQLYHGHDWDVSTQEAMRIQEELASKLRFKPLESGPETIAGVDVSFQRTGYKQYDAQCGIAVLSLPELEILDSVRLKADVTFPYVPGLLSFREIPSIVAALESLKVWPDVFMTDSQGYAHPRRFGLACHLGLALRRPTFGVAKSRLIGTHEAPGMDRGSRTPLLDGDEVIGAVVRTRSDVNPVYVSAGHLITLEESVALTLACAPRYKIPEPTRAAHRLSRES